LTDGLGVMDVGCGWGLAGIYCAKQHKAVVTCLDADPMVFPYLQLHREANQVEVASRNMGFADLRAGHFAGIDVMIGADICFYDEMVEPLKALIAMARSAGVRLIIIADPGRSPFNSLESYYTENRGGRTFTRSIERPFDFKGRILKIGSLTSTM